jgi:hypothetical protein
MVTREQFSPVGNRKYVRYAVSWLILFMEIITVYCENRMKPTNLQQVKCRVIDY